MGARRTTATIVVIAAIAGAVVWFALRRSTRPAEDQSAASDHAAAPSEQRLATAPAIPVKDVEPAPAPSATATPPSGHTRVAGRVAMPTGVGDPHGRVMVLDAARRLVGSGAIESQGAFALDVSAGEGHRVVVAVDGWGSKELPWSDATSGTTIRLEEGPFFSGTVIVNDSGERLRDLEVRLVAHQVGSQSVPIGWTSLDALGSDGASFAVTRTDSNGGFRFHGLLPATYVLVSGDPSWFLETPGGGTGQVSLDSFAIHGLPVIARPAARLRLEVVVAGTQRAVASFDGHLRDVTSSSFVAFGGAGGVADFTFPRWWNSDDPIALDLDVDAKGFEPARAPLRFERRQSVAEARIALSAVADEDLGKVTFEIVDALGKAIDAPWRVRIVDPRNADKTLREVDLERIDASHFRADVAPGRWTFFVSTGEGLGYLNWLHECDVGKRVATTIRCAMPPYGSLRVELPSSPPLPDGGPWLTLAPSAGLASMVPAQEKEFHAHALPEGDYKLSYSGFFGAGPRERPLRIRAGEETVVSFRDP